MAAVDVAALTAQVQWLGLALGLAFGAVAQRTHFCTMGAVADIVNMGDWSRLRMWALAIGVAMLGFNALVATGQVDVAGSLYAGPRLMLLSHAVGGALFGAGMVLASGCGSKTLVRIGGGNLKSVVVAVVLGVSAYATLRGLTALWRTATVDAVGVDLGAGQDLPRLLAAAFGGAPTAWAAGAGTLAAAMVIGWVLARPEGRRGEVLAGGLGIGATVVAAWWVSGHLGFVAEHPDTLEAAYLATNSRRMESLSFVAPVAWSLDWLMFTSDTSKVLTFGITTSVGVVLGSAAVALAQRSFRWEGFAGPEDTANHLVGAVLMGVGGITAVGCTIGQGISGLSTLSIGSAISLAGILAGAVAALKYQAWRIERMA